MATNESFFPRRRTRISFPAARTPRCAPPSSARTPRARCWSGGSRGTRRPGSTPCARSPRAPDPWTPWTPTPTAADSSRPTRDGTGRTGGTASSPDARSRRRRRGASRRRSTHSAGTGRGESWRRCGPPRTPRRGRRCPGSTTYSAARRRRGSSPTRSTRMRAWTTSTSTAGPGPGPGPARTGKPTRMESEAGDSIPRCRRRRRGRPTIRRPAIFHAPAPSTASSRTLATSRRARDWPPCTRGPRMTRRLKRKSGCETRRIWKASSRLVLPSDLLPARASRPRSSPRSPRRWQKIRSLTRGTARYSSSRPRWRPRFRGGRRASTEFASVATRACG
mmetsp:Transcript_4772/g.21778  ORF Transcript_4772/g.21778 Transcript_4772/m.21778 type:complete len:335 (-) Transcript_4772:491-1495(-)